MQILVGIFGRVYDVTSGSRHYGPGGSYHGFAGRDGTRAFSTGIFTADHLTDRIDDLEPQRVADIASFADLLHRKYTHIGHVVGAFYDDTGAPTAVTTTWLPAQLSAAAGASAAAEAERARHLTCNSRWTERDGGHVWCDHQGHVPRETLSRANGAKRCACVLLEEARADPGRWRVYAGCEEEAAKCASSPPKQT